MRQAQTIDQVKRSISIWKDNKQTIGFVPTMGALHKGHAKLIEASKQNNDKTVVSIFVNPTQFAKNEDLDQYPRALQNDLSLLDELGVDLVFLPVTQTIYPEGLKLTLVENHFSKPLCGAFRKGHFDGVCTVVSKLFNIVEPTRAYFGQKDAQQLKVIQSMAQSLFFPVQICPIETIRESDGLALSSRNQYLTLEQREIAPIIYKALIGTKGMFLEGENNTLALIETCKAFLKQNNNIEIQYVDLLEWETFERKDIVENTSLLAIACFLGKTRLIDNILLQK